MPPPETMKVLKPFAAQVVEQLEHRLVDHLGVAPAGLRMSSGSDPVGDDRCRTPPSSCRRGSPSIISTRPCSPSASAPFMSPLSTEAKGSWCRPFRMLRRQRPDAVEDEERLEVHRLLGPEVAVVVERGNALGERDEVRRARLRDLGDELEDGPLRRTVVPDLPGAHQRGAAAVQAMRVEVRLPAIAC